MQMTDFQTDRLLRWAESRAQGGLNSNDELFEASTNFNAALDEYGNVPG